MSTEMLQPVAALMLLTFVVWVWMYAVRFRYLLANRVPAHAVRTPELMAAATPESVSRPSNNFKNLFELPVLFYVLALALLYLDQVDSRYVGLAWAYVGFRVVHSAVQCTINHVPLRFAAYALSSVALWIMVLRFTFSLI